MRNEALVLVVLFFLLVFMVGCGGGGETSDIASPTSISTPLPPIPTPTPTSDYSADLYGQDIALEARPQVGTFVQPSERDQELLSRYVQMDQNLIEWPALYNPASILLIPRTVEGYIVGFAIGSNVNNDPYNLVTVEHVAAYMVDPRVYDVVAYVPGQGLTVFQNTSWHKEQRLVFFEEPMSCEDTSGWQELQVYTQTQAYPIEAGTYLVVPTRDGSWIAGQVLGVANLPEGEDPLYELELFGGELCRGDSGRPAHFYGAGEGFIYTTIGGLVDAAPTEGHIQQLNELYEDDPYVWYMNRYGEPCSNLILIAVHP